MFNKIILSLFIILILVLLILLLLGLINYLSSIKRNKSNKWKVNNIDHVLDDNNNKIKKILKNKILDNNLKFFKFTKKLLENHNISFWVEGGTLLGTVRHKGFIPWDDDIDINCWKKDEKKLEEALKKIPKKYSYIKCCGGYKIYRNNFFIHPRIDIYIVDYNNKQGCYGLCHPIKNNKCTFYQQNQSPSACYPLDYILPLKQLHFEDIKVPVPNKYLKIIEKRYSKKWREYKQSKLQTFQHSFSFFIPILPYIEKMYGKSFFNAFQNIDKEWN